MTSYVPVIEFFVKYGQCQRVRCHVDVGLCFSPHPTVTTLISIVAASSICGVLPWCAETPKNRDPNTGIRQPHPLLSATWYNVSVHPNSFGDIATKPITGVSVAECLGSDCGVWRFCTSIRSYNRMVKHLIDALLSHPMSQSQLAGRLRKSRFNRGHPARAH